MKPLKIFILFIAVLSVISCDRADLFKTTSDSDSKAITAFSFASPGVTGTIDQGAYTIDVTVPFGTDITALAATFSTTGVKVEVGGFEQESGTTTNNFSAAVVYTVTAGNGTTQDYTAVVTVTAPSTDKSITAFSFDSLGVTGTIDQGAFTVDVTVPFGTDITALIAAFTITGVKVEVGSVEQVSGTTPNDFSAAVVYTVTAEDSSSQNYIATVTVNTGTPYEIIHNSGSGSSLYGWRSSDGAVIGNGQSVYIDTDIYLESFSFYFLGPFGADVTVRLDIRDDGGNILQSNDAVMTTGFTADWLTWSGINRNISAGTTLVFTSYLVGGYDTNQYSTTVSFDGAEGYADGVRYMSSGLYDDSQVEVWSNWYTHTSDMYFHLQGVAP